MSKEKSASQLIDGRIGELGDWRGEMLARLRALVKQADPEAVEEWKWRGVPVWYHDGMICTGETSKGKVKMTFAKGAKLDDPSRLFNASLDGNVRRAIDFHEGDTVDEEALKALVPRGRDAERVPRPRLIAPPAWRCVTAPSDRAEIAARTISSPGHSHSIVPGGFDV